MGCCEGCARIILLIFNLLLFLIGAACLGVGIWVLVDGNVFLQVLGNIPNSDIYGKFIADAAYIIIGAGGVVFLISFFGCCGAWKKHKGLLMTYAVIVGVLLLLQIGVVVVAYFFYDNVIGIVNDQLASSLSAYDSSFTSTSQPTEFDYAPGSIISKGIDAIQIEFSCCGVRNYTDYTNGSYPPTCCNTTSTDIKTLLNQLWAEEMTTYTINDANCYTNSSVIQNTPGCSEAIKKKVEEYSLIVMIVAGCTMGVQLLLIMFACCLFCAVRKEQHKA